MRTPTTVHTISARRLHSSITIGSALLIVAAIAIVLLLRSPTGANPAARSIPAAVDSSASLDQHERHPAVTTNRSAPLDQHERHPAVTTNRSASLDQHERHPAVTTDRSAPLDQHERHLDLFAPKAEDTALLDALDRYLAARSR